MSGWDGARRAWIIRGCMVAAGLVAALIIWPRGSSCAEWQAEYQKVAEAASRGVFDFIGIGPNSERLEELQAERPDGCDRPRI